MRWRWCWRPLTWAPPLLGPPAPAVARSSSELPAPVSPISPARLKVGLFHWVLSWVILPSPLVSSTIGHQPVDFLASWVSSHTLVLIHDTTPVSPLIYRMFSLSKVKPEWLPPVHMPPR